MGNLDSTKSGCFSGFLKAFLCAGKGNTPPVHPYDHITESDETELVRRKQETIAKEAIPGVVARLMGLDSLPSARWVSKAATPETVSRSRSVNFVDYLLEFDQSQPNHRRVKTSASFREVPASLRQQGDDLVVLCWGNASENHRNLRKWEMGLGEVKQKKKQGSKSKEIARDIAAVKKEKNQGKNKKISKLKNEPRRVPAKQSPKVSTNHRGAEARDFVSISPRSKSFSYGNGHGCAASSTRWSSPLPNRRKGDVVESKKRNTRNKESPKKIETEYCSENLSPVSVLEVDYFPFLNEASFSEDLSLLASKSKWKSSEQLCLGDAIEGRASNDEGSAYPQINQGTEYYIEIMLKILRLTENELGESDCRPKGAFDGESFEEICLLIEHKIFYLLLHEVVSELVQL